MTTTPSGPVGPDPTQPILVGATRPVVPTSPAQYAASPAPPRRRPTGLIAAIVVLAVVVAGLGGWAVLRPYLGGTSGAPASPGTSRPATTAPAQPGGTPSTPPATTATQPLPTDPVPPTGLGIAPVPFDLLQGLAGPPDTNHVFVIGIWDGVAVFRMKLGALASSGGVWVVRAVDVRTGDVLWTLDALPDGRDSVAVTGAAAWNGSVALSVADQLDSDSPWTAWCTNPGYPAYILLVSLRDGTVTAAQPVDAQCAGQNDNDVTYSRPSVTAYADGVVVVDTNSCHFLGTGDSPRYSCSDLATTGYADTNLATPVWRVEGRPDPIPDGRPDPVLLSGHWILAASDAVVDVRTGQPSSLRGDPNGQFGFIAMGDSVVWGAEGSDAQVFRTFTMWSSPVSTQPEWTYTAPAGWDVVAPMCYSDDIMMVWLNNEGSLQASGSVGVVAVDRADGHTLWSATYPPGAGTWPSPETTACTIMGYEGDKELLVLLPYQGANVQMYLLDAVSGQEVMDTMRFPNLVSVVGLQPCGTDLVCALRYGDGNDDTSLLPISVARPAPAAFSPYSLGGQWGQGASDDGYVLVYLDGDCKGRFVLI